MTEIDKKKEYLSNYKNLYMKLKSLEEQLQSLREIKESAKVQKLSDMPKGSKQTDLSDIMVQFEILYTKIIRARADCMKSKLEIESQIADMPDGADSLIIHKRYIEFKQWEQICEELDYSWRQIHRLHSQALTKFKMA